MSVLFVNEMFLERGGDIGNGSYTVSRVFQVGTDSSADDAPVVLAAAGIPTIGSAHPALDTLWVSKIAAKPESSDGLVWRVTVGYEIKPTSESGQAVVYPWDLDPVIRYGTIQKQMVMEKAYATDWDETPAPMPGAGGNRPLRTKRVTNSAYLSFDPPAMFEENLLVISVSRAVQAFSFNPSDVLAYQNTINASSIRIAGITIPALNGYLRAFTADKAWYQDPASPNTRIAYYNQTFEIVVDPDTWLRRIVDAGLMEMDAQTYDWTPIRDKEGKRMLEPCLLDGAGKKLVYSDSPKLLNCHVLWEAEWGALGLPSGS